MFQRRTLQKIFDSLILFAVFFTPLLFFISSHDQFELPKLILLAVLTIPLLLGELKEGKFQLLTPLSVALLLLLAVETAASLPMTSLSWRTSLLGDYENFAGLATFILNLLWFRFFSRHLNLEKAEKVFLFNSLAAILSSLYAIAQHFGFDFIQWNAESVIATREFASLGNPNFLSAYLAMSFPLFLCVSVKNIQKQSPFISQKSFIFWVLGAWGLIFLLLGTPKVAVFLHLVPSITFQFLMRAIGLCLFSISTLRFFLTVPWISTCGGSIIMTLGLLATGSRGGFLGAVSGLVLWVLLAARNGEFWTPVREQFSKIPKSAFAVALVLVLALFFFMGRGFFNRLWDSTWHMGQSLANSRLHIWRPGVKMAEAKPLLGVGLDTFKIAFPYYSGIEFNQIDGRFMSSRMAHNELLQMACTTGFLGLVAYLGVLGAFLFTGWKTYRNASGLGKWLLAAVFASALAYQVQNLFSFGVASINLVWFLLLSIVQRGYRVLVSPPPSREEDGLRVDTEPSSFLGSKVFSLLEKPFIILLLFLLIWFPMNRLGADIAFGLGSAFSDALKNPNSQTSMDTYKAYSGYEIDLMQKAVKLCPLETKYVLYLGLAFEERAEFDSGHARDWEAEALGCYEKAVQMSPANAYYYNDEGRVCEALSTFDPSYEEKAASAYGEAVHWNPSSPFFNINWSKALSNAGKTEEAKAPMKKAFELDPNFAAQVLSQMAYEKYRAGNKPKAFEILADALQRNTTSAEAYYCRGIIYLQEKKKALALKDLEAAKSLSPTPEKNPSIKALDELIEQAKN